MKISTLKLPVRGFTLLEVLIAMVVIGIALLALASTGSKQVNQLQQLQQQTLAHWVAQNVITEFRLAASHPPGETSGIEKMGQQNWYWLLNAAAASDPLLLRLDVQVYADSAHQQLVLAETGFSLRENRR
ncbi:MAG: type II secretion system minor pseudopilin GspI [Xanthomonadales bacterium]|nr:type II secretion system minor pseudopilin GspI [Xanthomonadales bacterium]